MSRFNKFWAALAGVAAVAATASFDGKLTSTDVVLIVASAVSAVSVYLVKNAPATPPAP